MPKETTMKTPLFVVSLLPVLLATLALGLTGKKYWLYAATLNSLRYPKTIPHNPAAQWERASGIAGMAPVDGFNAATEDVRVVHYIGTSGEAVSTSSGASRRLATATGIQDMADGIYRSMVRINLLYLPLVRR
jgi:hypothetical protein